jgi:hypothetical protein
MSKQPRAEQDREVRAIVAVYEALKGLEQQAQSRVIRYIADRLQIDGAPIAPPADVQFRQSEPATERIDAVAQSVESREEPEGISPIAKKWMTRNDLNTDMISKIFSLGIDEIDLVAKQIPGDSKKDKMRSVFLLKGIAAYLGGGAARFTHEQVKEACLHYKAYDSANFAQYLKSFSTEISGDKNSGYSLTVRGMADATDLVKGMAQPIPAGKSAKS